MNSIPPVRHTEGPRMTRDLVLVSIALLTWGLGEGMFYFFNPLYLQQLGANPVTIGGVLGVMGVAMTVAHIPAGYLADKLGRRPLLLLAWAAGVITTWIMALAPGLTLFVVGLVGYGLTAFVISPLNSYVTGARGSLTPGRAMTLTSALYNIGSIAGPLIGGWIGDAYGLRLTYFISASIFVVSMAILLFIHSQPREHLDPASPPLNLLANRRYIGFMALVFIVMFATYLPQPLTPVFLQNERGINLDQIGQLGALSCLGMAVLNLVLGGLNARLGFFLGQAAVALFAFLMWRGSGMWWFSLGYFLLAGYRVIRPLISAQVRDLIHGSQMGLAYGITETINALPTIIAPPIAGLMYDRDPVSIYPVSLIIIVVSLVISLRFTPRTLIAPAPKIKPSTLQDDIIL
jgi:DHA1 family multidrug resistance protein-like MFS transporter